MKTERTYEIDTNVDAAVAIKAMGERKSGSEVVEEILRRDPGISKIIEKARKAGPLPDYDPRRSGLAPPQGCTSTRRGGRQQPTMRAPSQRA